MRKGHNLFRVVNLVDQKEELLGLDSQSPGVEVDASRNHPRRGAVDCALDLACRVTDYIRYP